MAKLVEPKVYLVGFTEANLAGLEDYLRETGQGEFMEEFHTAIASGISSGEALCSFYAKLCYKSLVLGKNENVSKVRSVEGNLKGTYASGHGCYDADTDVLTADGWKPWPGIDGTERLATLDAKGHLTYRVPVRITAEPYSGAMYRVESQHVDLLVTPNHRMYVCPTTTKQGRQRADDGYSLIQATDLDKTAHAYRKEAVWPLSSGARKYSELELRLLGFAIGDGYLSSTYRVKFRLRRPRKIVWLTNLVRHMRLEMLYDGADKYTVVLGSDRLAALFAEIYDADREKQIPQHLLTTQDAGSLSGLLEGLIESDGHRGHSGVSFDTTSPGLVGQFQQLCLHTGYAANIAYAYDLADRSAPGFPSDKTLTRLTVLSRSLRPEVNKHAGQVGRTYWIDGWQGDVYCAEMPSDTKHVVYVRRNGRPVWCGNSVFEHDCINFVATNVSRVCTHELVRHRVGTAFSQTSGRYCALDSIDLVNDPMFAGHEDMIHNYLVDAEAFIYLLECDLGLRVPPPAHPNVKVRDCLSEMKIKAYWLGQNRFVRNDKELEEMGEEIRWVIDTSKPFEWRKKVTSAVRRLAPNGQANEIGFSLNIRSLRYLLELRTSKHAETEIRNVFNQVYQIVKKKFPLMVHDAKEIDTGDGLLWIRGMRQQPFDRETDEEVLARVTPEQFSAEAIRRLGAAVDAAVANKSQAKITGQDRRDLAELLCDSGVPPEIARIGSASDHDHMKPLDPDELKRDVERWLEDHPLRKGATNFTAQREAAMASGPVGDTSVVIPPGEGEKPVE